MRITDIIHEFLDYRAYVSHTLCKHRLSLGLDSPGSARRRLQDASVWPLVGDEATRLLSLCPTLFGLESPSLRESGRCAQAALDTMTAKADGVFAGDEGELSVFRQNATRLSDELTRIGDLVQQDTPDFNGDAVTSYLQGRGPEGLLSELHACSRGDIAPLVSGLLNGGDRRPEIYRLFWPASSHALLLTRTAVVASAVEDAPKDSVAAIRRLQRTIRAVERVVSCWSPNVDPAGRGGAVEKALAAEEFRSPDGLLRALDELARSK